MGAELSGDDHCPREWRLVIQAELQGEPLILYRLLG